MLIVDICEVTVVPLVKVAETVPTWLGAFCGVKATYNWIGIDEETGEDVYIVSEIESYCHGVVGAYQLFVLFHDNPPPSWPSILWHAALLAPKDYTFCSPFSSLGVEVFGPLQETAEFTYPEGTFEGMGVKGCDSMLIVASGSPGFPRVYFDLAITMFDPDEPVVHLQPTDIPGFYEIQDVINYLFHIVVMLSSPAELRIYDSDGRVTGLVNGVVKEEIPGSFYNEDTVVIFSPSDSYLYEIAGTDEGTYGLNLISVEDGEPTTLAISDAPTASGAVHQYTIDWDALSQGEEGVTLQIDSDGDGTFEETTTIQPPTASFTYSPVSLVVTEEITFDASQSYDADGEIVSYEWSFGDGTTSLGMVVTHTYSTTRDYTVSLTVWDDDGAGSTYSRVIQVGERERGLPTWVWIAAGVMAALLVVLGAIIYRVKFKQPAVQVAKRKK